MKIQVPTSIGLGLLFVCLSTRFGIVEAANSTGRSLAEQQSDELARVYGMLPNIVKNVQSVSSDDEGF